MSDKELVLACVALQSSAPEAWKSFLVTLRGYTEETKNRLVSAPISAIQVAQGQAQQCQTLVDLFTNAVQTADRMKIDKGR